MAFVKVAEEVKAKFATTPIENELMDNYIGIINGFDHYMTADPQNAIHASALEEFAKFPPLLKKMKKHFDKYPALANFFKGRETMTRIFTKDLRNGAKNLKDVNQGIIDSFKGLENILNTSHS